MMPIKLDLAGTKYFYVLSLLHLLLKYTQAESSTEFLVTVCDSNNRVFCFGALLQDTLVVASPECSLRYMVKEKISVHVGDLKMLCDSKHLVSDSLEIQLTKPEKNAFLTLFHIPDGFPMKKNIEVIKPAEKNMLKFVGDVCEVYYYPYKINATQAIFKINQKDKFDQARNDKVNIYEGTIIFCGQDSKFLCVEIDEDDDISSSPVNCQGTLLGVIWSQGLMHNMILYTPKELLSRYMTTSIRSSNPNKFQPANFVMYLVLCLVHCLYTFRKI